MTTLWLDSPLLENELCVNIDSDNPAPGASSPLELFWIEDGSNRQVVFELTSFGDVRFFGPLIKQGEPLRVKIDAGTGYAPSLRLLGSTGGVLAEVGLDGRLDSSPGGVRVRAYPGSLPPPAAPVEGLCYVATQSFSTPPAFRCWLGGSWRST